jgi:hypothetical protein
VQLVAFLGELRVIDRPTLTGRAGINGTGPSGDMNPATWDDAIRVLGERACRACAKDADRERDRANVNHTHTNLLKGCESGPVYSEHPVPRAAGTPLTSDPLIRPSRGTKVDFE